MKKLLVVNLVLTIFLSSCDFFLKSEDEILSTPKNFSGYIYNADPPIVTQGTFTNIYYYGIHFEWEPVNDADGYIIYYAYVLANGSFLYWSTYDIPGTPVGRPDRISPGSTSSFDCAYYMAGDDYLKFHYFAIQAYKGNLDDPMASPVWSDYSNNVYIRLRE
jgi:hypothetical protein